MDAKWIMSQRGNAGRCNMPGEQRVESSWANSCDSLDLSTETLSRNARLHIRIQAKRLQETGTQLNRCNASRDRYSEENCDIMQQPEAFKAELSFISCLMVLACLSDRDLFLCTEIAQKTTFNCVQVNTMQWGTT